MLKYCLMGAVNNAWGYLVYLLITHWGLEPKKAMTMLYLLGATIGFFGNRQWVFNHKGSFLVASAKYIFIHFLGYLLNLCVLFFFFNKLGYPHQLVQLLAMFLVAGFLFLSFRYFVFREPAS